MTRHSPAHTPLAHRLGILGWSLASRLGFDIPTNPKTEHRAPQPSPQKNTWQSCCKTFQHPNHKGRWALPPKAKHPRHMTKATVQTIGNILLKHPKGCPFILSIQKGVLFPGGFWFPFSRGFFCVKQGSFPFRPRRRRPAGLAAAAAAAAGGQAVHRESAAGDAPRRRGLDTELSPSFWSLGGRRFGGYPFWGGAFFFFNRHTQILYIKISICSYALWDDHFGGSQTEFVFCKSTWKVRFGVVLTEHQKAKHPVVVGFSSLETNAGIG